MSITKRVGYGSTLGVDITGGTTFVVLAAVVDGFAGPEAKAKEANTSLLTDWYETSAPAAVDPGSLTFQIAYDPGDTITTKKINDLMTSGAIANWQLTYAGGTPPVETFLGYVSGIGREMKKLGMVVANITIRISGNPGFTQ